MKIVKLFIKQFGKFRDFELDFNDGLNIVSGNNELGKSTLQSFIKAMLFGLSAKKTKDSNLKERAKFKPWDGGIIAGEIHIEDDFGNLFVINRRFGDTPRSDETVILKNGKEVKELDESAPGVSLLNIEEEAFERTLLINQLSCKIDGGVNGEIETKLSNLHQSGDENVSYKKAKEALVNYRKQLKNERKTSNLAFIDKKQEELVQLYEEKKTLERVHHENIDDTFEIKNRRIEKENLVNELNETKKQKELLKKYTLYKEYKSLEELQNSIKIEQDKIDDINKELQFGDFIANEDFVHELSEDFRSYQQECRVYENLQIEKKNEELRYNTKQEEINDYVVFKDYEEDIDFKLIECTNKLITLKEGLKDIQTLKFNIKQLEDELESKTNEMGYLSKYENANSQLDTELMGKLSRISELKEKMKDTSKVDHLKLRTEMKEKDLKNSKTLVLLGILFTIIGILTGIFLHPIMLLTLFISIFLIVYGIRQKMRVSLEIENNYQMIAQLSGLKEYEIEKVKLEQELKNIFSFYSVKTLDEYLINKDKYQEKVREIDVQWIKLNNKKEELKAKDEDNIVKEIEMTNAFIHQSLSNTNCTSIDQFIEQNKTFKRLCLEKTTIEKSISNIQTKINHQLIVIENEKSKLLTKLGLINQEEVPFNEIDSLILTMSNKFKHKLELLSQINVKQSLYDSKLTNRKLDENIDELKTSNINDFSSVLGQDEMSLEQKIETIHNEINEIDNTIREIEHRIDKRLINKRNIDDVLEEIQACETVVAELEKQLTSINISLDVLDEAYNDLQKSFGPELNKCVENVIASVTNGKYTEIAISEDFEIKVKDPHTGIFKDIQFLSNGTLDQIYLSLRLALTELLYKDKECVPLLMDDSFVQYDDERVKRALDYLLDNLSKKQVILFTCHKREVDYLIDDERVNIIDLNKKSA